MNVIQYPKVSILTAGKDPHYALGLLDGLVSKPLQIDFIANNDMQSSPLIEAQNVRYFNLRGDQTASSSIWEKATRLVRYYFALMKYSVATDSQLFHILWFNKFEWFDNTFLIFFYKIFKKKIIYTAHNVNTKERDGKYDIISNISLKFLYKHVDHIIVHTETMKKRMIDYFYINSNKISVFPFGINNVVPRSRMTNLEARSKVSINSRKKLLLFFGNIAPYKGLDILIDAMTSIDDCELVIAGRINNCHSYWENIEKTIENRNLKDRVIQDIEFIPDERIEIYFKAADLLILPYRRIDQSGVLFLSYSFGLPVIAADVGDLSKNIIEGITGYVFEAGSSNDLSNKINMYFESELFKNIEKNRELIIQYVVENNSWGNITKEVNLLYRRILEPS